MVFDIKNKVALITGGANGIGLHCARSLLSEGLEGVTLVDINEEAGEKAAANLNQEFGKTVVLFVKTDITNYHEFEAAFKATVDKFGHVDILLNNAGIGADGMWRKEVEVNVIGTVNGMILGFDNYLNKYMADNEAVIINTSSTTGLEGYPQWPIYSATKFAIVGMVRSWGSPIHYERTKVRVVGLCPCATNTDFLDPALVFLGPAYEKTMEYIKHEIDRTQEPEHVAAEVVKLIQNAKNGSIWVVEYGDPAYEYVLPRREDFKN